MKLTRIEVGWSGHCDNCEGWAPALKTYAELIGFVFCTLECAREFARESSKQRAEQIRTTYQGSE